MKKKQIKEKVTTFLTDKAIPMGSSLMSMGIMMSSTLVYADAASSLMETVIDILCKLVIVLGAVLCLMGVIHYASANSEGDGPAKQKAIMQIASGIMLVVLSAVLDSQKSSFVSIITT